MIALFYFLPVLQAPESLDITAFLIRTNHTPVIYKKLGYKTTCVIAAVTGGVSLTAAFLLGKINIYFALPFMTIGGLSLGSYNVLPYPMVGDSLDYLEWKTGERMEGVCFSLNSFVTKFNNAVGFIGLSAALTLFHFIEPSAAGVPAVQSASTVTGLFSLVTVIPGIGFLLSLIPICFYDFSGVKKGKILSELAVKRKAIKNGV